jgi:hypothetical protein
MIRSRALRASALALIFLLPAAVLATVIRYPKPVDIRSSRVFQLEVDGEPVVEYYCDDHFAHFSSDGPSSLTIRVAGPINIDRPLGRGAADPGRSGRSDAGRSGRGGDFLAGHCRGEAREILPKSAIGRPSP